ncbi:hypothetical protein DEIGR_102013 [Deinococcus grandis]|uniref:Uncharacterized protein n=1 Tax=Deinococcus grandis TaxID=57498 RepID=A0A100HJN7_9DEIO|nr:hypothetical protein [Deinococcus grandis]GAQ21986.1 hypothetical protein DEIGR_102013 [Deinococcus grandis]
MNRTLIVLTALTLGTAALAEGTAPTTPAPTTPAPTTPAPTTPAPTTTVTLPGNVTASAADAWKAFIAAGGTATLLGADGSVIGTLNADGTVTLTGTATLSDVRSVTLTPATGEALTVNVTRDLSRPGAIKIEFTDARGRTQSLPLPAVANRLKAAPGSDDTDESGEDGDKDKSEKSGKDGKDDKGGKPSTNPGKGRP